MLGPDTDLDCKIIKLTNLAICTVKFIISLFVRWVIATKNNLMVPSLSNITTNTSCISDISGLPKLGLFYRNTLHIS